MSYAHQSHLRECSCCLRFSTILGGLSLAGFVLTGTGFGHGSTRLLEPRGGAWRSCCATVLPAHPVSHPSTANQMRQGYRQGMLLTQGMHFACKMMTKLLQPVLCVGGFEPRGGV